MSTEACNLLRPLLCSVLLPAGAFLSQPAPMKARAARKNNRGLYRVNQYRPRIPNMTAAQLHAASIITPNLTNQPYVIKVHRPRAARCRVPLSADANGNRIDIGKIHACERLQVDDPFFPSGPLRCSSIVVINH